MGMKRNVTLDCGWGHIFFGQTFENKDELIDLFKDEREGRRDLAMYVREHQVLLAKAPELLFVDPSLTYRLWLSEFRPFAERKERYVIRQLMDMDDAEGINRVYDACGMVTADPERIVYNQSGTATTYFVAVDLKKDRIIGTIMGVDHKQLFGDPDNGSSFWCLAVDPKSRARGVGRNLIRYMAEYFQVRGREYMDLSVLHDNHKAIRLYQNQGFRQVPVYVVKRKNEINSDFYRGGPKP